MIFFLTLISRVFCWLSLEKLRRLKQAFLKSSSPQDWPSTMYSSYYQYGDKKDVDSLKSSAIVQLSKSLVIDIKLTELT